ncbi:MAG: IS110 family transposase [Acidobacteriota bacterium]|nr:IS110 family transposase [Acidobacteriota bacterium]
MTIYYGVDFHARSQMISYLDTVDGEVHTRELHHQKDDVRAFYQQLSGEVIVGLEASGYSSWFEEMLESLGHKVWVGDATEIRRLARRRQKNDKRDAEHILDLLVKDEFPRLQRQRVESREVLRQLRYRQRLVKISVMIKNNLHAIALGAGLSLQTQLSTIKGRERLEALPLSGALAHQRESWLQLLERVREQITSVERWLKGQASGDVCVVRLRTHPGVGLLTSLCLVHTLGDVSRFATTRKVVAYAGLEPMEHSSAETKRYGAISKAGSRLLRFLLGEAAQVAVRTDAELRAFYQRLLTRRGKAKAVVAVARKLLVRCFIMLRDEIDYAEFRRRGIAAQGVAKSGLPALTHGLIDA